MNEPKSRKTIRLKSADYNRNQAVFLTICTKERKCILSRIVGTGVLDGPKIELTKYGQIADKYINQLSDFYDNLSVESYVIMPNHIHIMLWVKTTESVENKPSRTFASRASIADLNWGAVVASKPVTLMIPTLASVSLTRYLTD